MKLAECCGGRDHTFRMLRLVLCNLQNVVMDIMKLAECSGGRYET